MKHLRNSLVVFAAVLAGTGVVTFLIPSHTRGSSNDVPKTAFSVVKPSPPDTVVTVISGPDAGGTSYAITSLTVTNQSESDSANVLMQGSWGFNPTDCVVSPGESLLGPQVKVPAGQTVHVSFPQPFVLSARPGAISCLRIGNVSGEFPSLVYIVVGYRF
jgi:hypothetical protein